MTELRKYGVLLTTSTAIKIVLYQPDGVKFGTSSDFPIATGDILISKDNGAYTATINPITAIGNSWYLILELVEMQARTISIMISDQTNPQLFLDTEFHIETYGDVLAMHQFDLDNPNVTLAALTHTGAVIPNVSNVDNAVLLPSIPVNWITAGGINPGAMDGKGDWNIGKTGYTLSQSFPANFANQVISASGATDSLIQGFLNSIITEVTAGRIAGNFGVFYRNADALTGQTVDDVGGGGGGGTDWTASERNEIRGRLGITGTTAAGGNTPTLALEATINAVKADTAAILTDTADMQPKLGAPSTTISGDIATRMAEASINTTAGVVDRVALVDVTTLNTDMRGTDGVVSAPTAVQNRQEMDTNSTQFVQIASDVVGLSGAPMRGTDGANTVVPDPAGTGPTKNDIAASFTEIKGGGWNSIDHTLEAIGDDTNANIPALLNDIAITKNQAGVLHVEMVLSTDGRSPGIGLTVTAQRLIDSGTYVNVSGVITEVSNGTYRFAYNAADSNGDMITWKFSSATADDTKVTFLTVA